MNGAPLVHVEVRGPEDVLAVRSGTRRAAEALGVDDVVGVRVTTSAAALAHDLVAAGGGRVRLLAPAAGSLVLQAEPDAAAHPAERGSWAASAPVVALVVESVDLDDSGLVTVAVSTGPTTPPAGPDRGADATATGADAVAADAADWAETVREQERDLLLLLARLALRRQEDARPPSAVPDTTDPEAAVALYHELSEELERTNQGVVALYAELDDKSRQLREASEAKSRFMRNISHELRSPANSIVGLTRLLLDVPPDADLSTDQREQVGFIASSAGDLLELVDELLDLAAAESGHLEVTPESIDLAALVEDLEGTTRPLLREGVELWVTPPPAGAQIRTDRTLLRHVLRNLLSNAAKFTAEGHVGLEHRLGADRVVLEVSDTGIGIGPEDQERVFEEFFQVRSPLHAGVRGTGLGLPYARRIAAALGGTLQVSSAPGYGSRFTVDLPRELDAHAPAPGSAPDAEGSQS